MEHHILIGGMSCAMCAARVEKCVAALPGVREVQVNLPARRMRVVSEGELTTQQIADAVVKAG